MSDKTKTLTKGEEDIMKILWMLGKGTVNDILEHCDEPKPKYTTVATFLKLLEDKGFAGHTSTGKSNMYYPVVEQKEYAGSMLDSFFGGSLVQILHSERASSSTPSSESTAKSTLYSLHSSLTILWKCHRSQSVTAQILSLPSASSSSYAERNLPMLTASSTTLSTSMSVSRISSS